MGFPVSLLLPLSPRGGDNGRDEGNRWGGRLQAGGQHHRHLSRAGGRAPYPGSGGSWCFWRRGRPALLLP